MEAEDKVILERPQKSGQIIGKFLIFTGLFVPRLVENLVKNTDG
jgi:hypothetical protein